MKTVLILTAGFGEGHNAAARGIRDGLLQIAPETRVQVRDLFAETFGRFNDFTRRGYLMLINRVPQVWSVIYSAIDRRKDFRDAFRWLAPVRLRLNELIAREEPSAIVSVYPAYPHLLDEMLGSANGAAPKRIICVTDSISVNAVWYRCSADFFLTPNEQTSRVLAAAGVRPELIYTTGFPVSPRFAELAQHRGRTPPPPWRILLMVNPGNRSASELAGRLAGIPATELTITVAGDEELRRAIEAVRSATQTRFDIIGWTSELPKLLNAHHLLISKAGGATVQEAIAAECPIVINQIVPGQEEGNAQLIRETNCGTVALNNSEVITAVECALTDQAKLLCQWMENLAHLSRPAAALEIAKFILEV